MARSTDAAPPKRVAVIGAGMVGLATAWFLRERGVEVTVFERRRVAAGASWGNAGWLAPALTTPLPEPAVLRYGVRAVLDPASPVYLPPRADPRLWRFLVGFARHCTPARWRRAMAAYREANARALDAFDALRDDGIVAPTHPARPFLACFRTARDRRGLLDELTEMRLGGQDVEFEVLDGAQARELEPALTENVGAALRLDGQRFINPPEYVRSLAEAVRARGAVIHEHTEVRELGEAAGGVLVHAHGQRHRYDAVVVAAGAWLNQLTGRFGVRMPVQAGRGYSFSVATAHPPAGPIYLPTQRVACTPLDGRLRVAGMMEFRRPDDPLDPRRIRAVSNAARPFLRGVEPGSRRDEWVGSRPCTPDGLPLVGRTAAPGVFVAGGHGMWGIVLGPLTGQLLAEAITTGRTPPALAAFDPLRPGIGERNGDVAI
ncbi:NAD(P)/FAD-dependent oxidoreductase [Pseudonocardia acaciae]|uniref:NAD(P)/FAD-dependent oxidoreductase n=1 Tax=Pseudonocardia acaciae TaxID=551276 RepID=UPI0006874FAA|nr:FAD-dependent oxidoreductase [Pseudonocardia acaciae]